MEQKSIPLPTINLRDAKGAAFTIRPFATADATSLQQHLNDERVARDVSNIPFPYEMHHAEAWVNACEDVVTPDSKRVDFAIDIDGQAIGSVAFINVDGHKAQISSWVNPKYWRRGIATIALKAMIDFGFEELGLVRMYAYHYAQNMRTGGMLRKLGFKFEGVHEKEWYRPKTGELYDSLYYALVRPQIPKRFALYVAEGSQYRGAQQIAANIVVYLNDMGVEWVQNIDEAVDMVIAVGGDGTMMRAMRIFSPRGVPVFGINAGDVGFLTATEADEWQVDLDRVLRGDFVVDRRMALMVRWAGREHGPFVNEVLVQHKEIPLRLDVVDDGLQLWKGISARGFMVATATGSTAQNFSSGGRIMFPHSREVSLTPINAQTANVAPLSTPTLSRMGSVSITLGASKYDGMTAEVRADGREVTNNGHQLRAGETIEIYAAPHPMLLVWFGRERFREKLEAKGFTSVE